MLQTKVAEKIKRHISLLITFTQKSCRLWDNLGKCGRAGHAAGDNMAQAHCLLDN